MQITWHGIAIYIASFCDCDAIAIFHPIMRFFSCDAMFPDFLRCHVFCDAMPCPCLPWSTYNPRNPNVASFIEHEMTNIMTDPVLKNIFEKYTFIKSKRQPKSLEDLLVKSYFYMDKPVFGVKPCNVPRCKTCPNILPTDQYYFSVVDFTYYIRLEFDCTATDIIYVLTCKGEDCGAYYIGKTVNLRNRMTKHRSCITDELMREQKVYQHIADCGHGNFWVTPFYKMKRSGLVAHIATEDYFINKFKPILNTKI